MRSGPAWGLVGAACAGAAVMAATSHAGPGGAAEVPAIDGAALYARCQGCHSLERDRTGPRHCGLLGRPAGSVPGFPYSEAMATSGITWDEPSLLRFLADPTGVVPGTTMTYLGVPDPAERRALVSWLAVTTKDPTICPDNPGAPR